MSQAPSVAFPVPDEETAVDATDRGQRHREHVSLRGTTRGLEILITGTPSTASLGERLAELLAEAPSFFAGSDARVVFEHALPPGALSCLEEVATRFELRLVEITPLVIKRRRTEVPRVLRPEDLPLGDLADGTGPFTDDVLSTSAGSTAAAAMAAPPSAAAQGASTPHSVATNGSGPNGRWSAPNAASLIAVEPSGSAPIAAPEAVADVAASIDPGPRLVIGPVRSGTIVDHPGHLVVIGDVNPGAEIRAEGSIIVLGRMRGVAHAAIGRDRGFIVALSLQPQQLRIARMAARAADADRPSDGAEIAYASGETIVVERFLGRLPSGLAASM
jgi:septum formation inhibitor MinC